MERWIAGSVTATIVIVWVSAAAWAGSQTDPEIKDPAGDGSDQGRDIVAVWLSYIPPTEDATEGFAVSIETATTPTASYPALHGFQNRWTVWFVPTAGLPAGKSAAYVSFRYGFGTTASTNQPVLNAYLGFTTAAGTFDNLNTEISIPGTITGKVFGATAPMTNFKGFAVGTDALTKIYANVVLVTKGPATNVQNQDANTIHQTYDRAPNSGFGRDLSTATTVAGPAAIDFLVEVPANATVPVNGTTQVSAAVTNNASNPFNATLSLVVSGPVNATSESTEITVGANTTTRFNITIEGLAVGQGAVDGTLTGPGGVNQTFQVLVDVVAGLGDNATPPSEAASPQAATESGGIPAPGLAAAGAGLLLATWARRTLRGRSP